MSIAACASLVQSGDPDRFLATMTAPPETRAALFVLYAFNLEVAKAPWVTSEPLIAQMRLQWWRDVIADAVAGRPIRAHEVAESLADLIAQYDIADLLDAMVAAREWDIKKRAFADAAALDAHLDATSGHLMWAAALTCGASPDLEQAVRDVGFGLGVANWLRAVPAYVAQGRIPLVDGRDQGVQALANAGLARLASARRVDLQVALPALRPAWQARAVLAQAVSDPARVSEGQLGTSEFRRRGSLLWAQIRGRW
jgi:phytoene/squalene synthetase